ncbi:hypothetical protein TRAPUB_10893 [Trametes pubescens]|uniref:Uncharacterized protein n=1 Tax=Trametes pubescens TaxID=154538 RepID=A0A1M2VY79_TRAPU|nr:hypothetical protein TRAPUB_10893 [Trametes pubescens]
MSTPLYYRQSNSSEESPLQDDRSDSEPEASPDDVQDPPPPLDPRNSALSLVSGAGFSLNDRRNSRQRDFDRRSVTNRDFFKYLLDDNMEAKKLRKVLNIALERLDNETRRAQEAERRALDLAQRFKLVSDARLTTQQELDRSHAELRMYKVQLDNAQREILRGSDLLKDIEAQRDSAEASAARARSTARRLKEEQLMLKAREEGRKEGYREGLQRGYQQARGTIDGQQDALPIGIPPFGGVGDEPTRMDPLDTLPMMNFASPAAPGNIPLSSTFGAQYQDGSALPVDHDAYGAGAQGSRFHEIIGSPSASTLRSAPLSSATRPGGSSGWPQTTEDVRYIRPTPVHNAPPSPHHVDYTIPPDGYIPAMGPDNTIPIPPPHELERPPSMSSMRPSEVSMADEHPSRAPPGPNARDYGFPQQPRASPRSYAESLPSTTISQFDLVNPATRALRERNSGLSAIPEVSSSMEFSPSADGRVRSGIYPDSSHYGPNGSTSDLGNGPRMSRSRSKDTSQRMADELRYSDPEEMEHWRRSTASQSQPGTPTRDRHHGPPRPSHITTPSPLGGPPITPTTPVSNHRRSHSAQSPPSDGRSYLGSGARDHRRTGSSSADISINIEPPSGPASNVSPGSLQNGMLSPSSSRQPLPHQPVQPAPPVTVYSNPYDGGRAPPGGYGYGQPNPPPPQQYVVPPSLTPGVPPSPRRTPEPLQAYPAYPTPGSSSSGSFGRPMTRQSRAPSADYGATPRSRTPSGRPSSAYGNVRPSSARPITPVQPYPAMYPSSGGAYPDSPSTVPSVLRSPSRPPSRQSLQPDPLRSPSRSSADHHRSLSFNAGSTPAMVPRPLSGGSQLRRVPSATSINSETSRKIGGYQHYDPTEALDAALLASAEDLRTVQSPHTMANTRANAAAYGGPPGPSKLRSSSPSMSYASFRS